MWAPPSTQLASGVICRLPYDFFITFFLEIKLISKLRNCFYMWVIFQRGKLTIKSKALKKGTTTLKKLKLYLIRMNKNWASNGIHSFNIIAFYTAFKLSYTQFHVLCIVFVCFFFFSYPFPFACFGFYFSVVCSSFFLYK